MLISHQITILNRHQSGQQHKEKNPAVGTNADDGPTSCMINKDAGCITIDDEYEENEIKDN